MPHLFFLYQYFFWYKKSQEFFLSEEQFAVLGDENSISLMIGGFENLVGAIHNIDIIKDIPVIKS